nr:reverse transcriptase domain-containing protein [Tanacetum cinerariifolium]
MNTTSRENASKMDDRIDKLADQISTLVDIFAKKVVILAPIKAAKESCVTCGGPHTHSDFELNDQKLRKKATNQIEMFFQIFQDLHFDISFTDALLLMPKLASTFKCLLTNKDKLFELAKIPLNDNCSVMLLKNLSEKLGDPSKFLIPFVDFEADPRVPLILGRSFLRTGRALIDVYGEAITFRVNDEAITFNLNQTTRYSSYDDFSVSHIHCVPKKGGITVVENENNELIPPRVCMAEKLLISSKLVMKDPPRAIMVPISPPRKAIISDRVTYFCNDKFAKVMSKYGVTHRLAIAYHPQTSGQVEVSNRGLKRILERTHKAYWALKDVNFDLKTTGDHQKLQLNELNELQDQAYENSLIHKEKTKKLHDSKIKNHIFSVGDRVLLFNSRLKIFLRKLKTRWSRPFTITKVFPYGTIELSQPDGPNFKVNSHRVKPYFRGDVPQLVVPDL